MMIEKPLAYDAYQELADHYAAGLETKPHNAYYDRPAMIAMWPELSGRRVLDAGCGPGLYAELLLKRGAQVTAMDASDRMVVIRRLTLNTSRPTTIFQLSTSNAPGLDSGKE
jgi:2-polyprenyl-3-methyl-5-hydroxy-6-metoxy-1,4-benzoquinol methylase